MSCVVPNCCDVDTAIVWFRRDLRLDDNPALTAALQTAANVIPVYIWAPEEEGQFQPGRCSRWWMKQSLAKLRRQLESLGSKLIVRRASETRVALQELVQDTGAQAVFFNHLYDPISLVRDHEVKQGLANLGVLCKSFNADLLYEPWEVLDDEGQPFTTFADFWNKIVSMPYQPPFPTPAPATMPSVSNQIPTKTLEQVDWFFTAEQEASSEQLGFKWKPGVEGAVQKLESFLENRLSDFEHDRAKVDRDSTSQLSPWVHSGTISVRYIYYMVKQKQVEWMQQGIDRTQSCVDFLQQMGYREYSRYLSFHFPFIHERSLLAHLRACPWRIDQFAFKAWKQGLTGYPLVDAGMRQLWSTGWIHNRLRVVVASFMVKNLLLPWQWGLKHYWDALLDADLECDALGWQYVSGGMSDAHPFEKMIDLESESARFDPDGEYVRRWLPVLARLPTKYIHAPWAAPPNVLAAADIELGFNYPFPIVTVKESKHLVANACEVLEKCQVSGGSVRHPYRQPTTESMGLTQVQYSQSFARVPGSRLHTGDSTGTHQNSQPGAKDGRKRKAEEWEEGSADEEYDSDSEEVMSNTIGEVSCMPTACSGFDIEGSAHKQQASIGKGRTVPTITFLSGATVPSMEEATDSAYGPTGSRPQVESSSFFTSSEDDVRVPSSPSNKRVCY